MQSGKTKKLKKRSVVRTAIGKVMSVLGHKTGALEAEEGESRKAHGKVSDQTHS